MTQSHSTDAIHSQNPQPAACFKQVCLHCITGTRQSTPGVMLNSRGAEHRSSRIVRVGTSMGGSHTNGRIIISQITPLLRSPTTYYWSLKGETRLVIYEKALTTGWLRIVNIPCLVSRVSDPSSEGSWIRRPARPRTMKGQSEAGEHDVLLPYLGNGEARLGGTDRKR